MAKGSDSAVVDLPDFSYWTNYDPHQELLEDLKASFRSL